MTGQKISNAPTLQDVIKELLARQAMGGGGGQNNPTIDAIHAKQASQDWSYGLGRLLNKLAIDGYNAWKKNYDDRGEMKAQKQEELTEQFKQQYGDQSGAVIEDLKNQGIWDRWDKLRQFDPSTYNNSNFSPTLTPQEAAIHAARQAADKIAPLPDNYRQEQPQAWENLQGRAADKALPISGFFGNNNSLTQAADPTQGVGNSFNNPNEVDWKKILASLGVR